MFGFFERKMKAPPINRERSLSSIPIRNEGVDVDESDPDNLVLNITLQRGTGFLARFQPPEFTRVVKLDELGSFVFKQVDGKTTTMQIIQAFKERYKLNAREAELSCVTFIKSLTSRYAVSIAVKK